MKTKITLGILILLISTAHAQPNLEITPGTWFNITNILPGDSVSKNIFLKNTGKSDIDEIEFYVEFNNSCTPTEPNNYCNGSPKLTDALTVDLIYDSINITPTTCLQVGDGICPVTITELNDGILLHGIGSKKSMILGILITFDQNADNEYQATSATINFSFIAGSHDSQKKPRRRHMTWEITDEFVGEMVSINVKDKNTDKLLNRVDVDIFLDGRKVKSMLTEYGRAWFVPEESGIYWITAKKSGYRDLDTYVDITPRPTTTTTTTTTSTTTSLVGCTSHHEKKCLVNFLWWVDSCGEYEEIAERCKCGCTRLGECITHGGSSLPEIENITISPKPSDVTTSTTSTTPTTTTTTIPEEPSGINNMWLLIILIVLIVIIAIFLYKTAEKNDSEVEDEGQVAE